MIWNHAVDKFPHCGLGNTWQRKALLLHVLKISTGELHDLQLSPTAAPSPRVMRLIKMIAGEDGRTWLKAWLRDHEAAPILQWPDGSVVFEDLHGDTWMKVDDEVG